MTQEHVFIDFWRKYAPMAEFKNRYRACEKFGLGVLHTFKLNAPPAWMNLTRSFNLDDFGDLDSPAFRDALKKFVVRSAERYAKSPALVAWCPWNEPRFPMPQRFAPYALDAYRDHLKRRHDGKLENLNAIYFHRFPTWEKVFEPDAPIQPQTLMDYPERMDFLAFQGDMLARLLKDVESWINEVDGYLARYRELVTGAPQGAVLSVEGLKK